MADRGEQIVAKLAFEHEPCRCVKHHRPRPLGVEMHHVFPQAEQVKRYGKVVDKTLVSLCATAHENVHDAISRWLKGEDDFKLPNRHQQEVAEAGLAKIKGR